MPSSRRPGPLTRLDLRMKNRSHGQRQHWLSPVRRVDRVLSPANERIAAFCFTDGPTAALPRPERKPGGAPRSVRQAVSGGSSKAAGGLGITDIILDVLRTYQAKATFAVVGSTAMNYPDQEGPLGGPYWNGIAYDHFPEFGQDSLAGVLGQAGLAKRILAEGHELANHSHRHLPVGPVPVAKKRSHHTDAAALLADVSDLHTYVAEHLGYVMRLGQPPHWIDGPVQDEDVFDVFARLGYNYLGEGLDGGGWRETSGSYDNDVETMVLGLQRMLEADGAALSGWIITQRDGYDMSRESPVVTAFPRQMQLFRNYGYRVTTVSELLERAPFADLAPDSVAFPAAKALLDAGWWVCNRMNEVRPHSHVVRGELAVWSMGAAKVPPRTSAEAGGGRDVAVYSDLPAGHPYRWHVETAAGQGLWKGVPGTSGRPSDPDARGSRVFGLWDPVGVDEFAEVMRRAGVNVGRLSGGLRPPIGSDVPPGSLTHAQALVMIHEATK